MVIQSNQEVCTLSQLSLFQNFAPLMLKLHRNYNYTFSPSQVLPIVHAHEMDIYLESKSTHLNM